MTLEPTHRKNLLQRLLELPLHPFLFGVYAIAFLWSQNVSKVKTVDVIQPLVVVLVATAVLYAIAFALLRNAWRAATVVSIISFLVFSYGHLVGSSVKNAQLEGSAPPQEGLWMALWAVLAIVGIVFVWRVRAEGRRLAFVLNAVLGVLVLMAVVTIGMQKMADRRELARVAAANAGQPAGAKPDASATPRVSQATKRDIYFIILDRYANQQTLKENYDYDNTYFIEGLGKRGFFVASKSRGPYPKTPHSIQTTLNMEFLDLPKDSSNWQLVYNKLKNPKSAQFLKKQGYKYVLMGSGYHSLINDPAADINIVYDPKAGPAITEFSQVLFDSTILAAIGQRYDVAVIDHRRGAYERAQFQYDQIPKIAAMSEPTFMFSHILITHPPYVVDENCKFTSEEKQNNTPEKEAYTDSVECEGKKTLALIDKLQDVPDDKKPVIIIQSDEGPGPIGWNPNTKEHFDWTTVTQPVIDEKFRIFNSYYFPGLEDTGLYENISPVNSFRLLFDKYFDAGLPLLPDKSYVFRNELRPYDFIDVTERVKN